MYRYLYLKKNSPGWREKVLSGFKIPKISGLRRKYFAVFLVVLGIFFASSALWPILDYQIRYASRFTRIYSPLSATGQILGNAYAVPSDSKDYTLVSSWFVTQPRIDPPSDKIKNYKLTIPRLGIVNAQVRADTEDLKKSLIHYAGPAPGEYGNTVVVGHSTLPQLFNPKNYLTIFSTLYQLKEGEDEIIAEYEGVFYRYVVEQIFEVLPQDLSVLKQDYSRRCITLITCSPPGTYLRRLIVKGCLSE